MIIDLMDEDRLLPEGAAELIERAAEAALWVEGVSGLCAGMSIVDGKTIKSLNARTRGVDSETDVLSFPLINYPNGKTAKDEPALVRRRYDPEYGAPYIGDIVLNISRAQQQAQEYGHSTARETAYLTCHAMLRLMGYDHMTDGDKQKMRAMEKRAMRQLGLFRNGEDA